MIAAVAGCFSALKSFRKNLPIVFSINMEISLFCGSSTWTGTCMCVNVCVSVYKVVALLTGVLRAVVLCDVHQGGDAVLCDSQRIRLFTVQHPDGQHDMLQVLQHPDGQHNMLQVLQRANNRFFTVLNSTRFVFLCNYFRFHSMALLHKSAAVNFDDFVFCSCSLIQNHNIDYKSDGIISGIHKKYF